MPGIQYALLSERAYWWVCNSPKKLDNHTAPSLVPFPSTNLRKRERERKEEKQIGKGKPGLFCLHE